MNVSNIAGLSMKGGKTEQFFFCILEYFAKEDRWFLKSLSQGNEINKYIDEFNLNGLVVDLPLSSPFCHGCLLPCPGIVACPVQEVKSVFLVMEEILGQLDILSKPLKRKLKKGFIPYWNRAIDLWIWLNYHDALLEIFNVTYDSFGNTSLMSQSKFNFFKKQFPGDLRLFEGSGKIVLLELIQANILKKSNVIKLKQWERLGEVRMEILRNIESKLNIFIYHSDFQVLADSYLAFESFLLAVAGKNFHSKKIREIPLWGMNSSAQFLAPCFL